MNFKPVTDINDPINDWGSGNCRQENRGHSQVEILRSSDAYAREASDAYLWLAMQKILDPQTHSAVVRDYKPAHVMKALKLRARIQSSFFNVYMHLYDMSLLTFDGLKEPMDPSMASDKDLSCFQKVGGAIERDWESSLEGKFDPFLNPMDCYKAPVNWLASLIVRGTAVKNLHAMMDSIESCGEFGVLDREKLAKVWPTTKLLEKNLDAGIVPMRTGRSDSRVVAFWLPHNLGCEIPIESMALYRYFVRTSSFRGRICTFGFLDEIRARVCRMRCDLRTFLRRNWLRVKIFEAGSV